MATLGSIAFIGKSKTSYSFNVYPITEECPGESGIYIFSKRELKNQNYYHTAIYIGMAKSFEKRFFNHHKEDCIKANGANCICLMQVKDEKQRAIIEKDLLDAYNTKCNEVNNQITPK